jgi:phosphoribosylaminoimidazolecarboxamide formyltransferase/IMP cyclohydrolase
MSEQNEQGLRHIGRALLSASDKTGLVEFARELRGLGVELLSTGGTAKALREAGLEVRDVADVTGFPEMLDGRVKTLHPRIHGGLLAVRDDESHMAALGEHGIEPIDMIVINLYPFEQTVARAGVTLEEAIEQIDIGGPAMVRSAAKNWDGVAVVTAPALYESISREMKAHNGALTRRTRARLALAAFARTSSYDTMIAEYLRSQHAELFASESDEPFASESVDSSGQQDAGRSSSFAIRQRLSLSMSKISALRYGENPHQLAALYAVEGEAHGLAQAEILSGKEMSFNNYIDADAAWQLVSDFDELACAIIKHTNPAGVATGASAEEAYRRALSTDPTSAFGGIVAFNHKVDAAAARAVSEIFTEVVVAPDFDGDAFEVLRAKKNLRILRLHATRDRSASIGDNSSFADNNSSSTVDNSSSIGDNSSRSNGESSSVLDYKKISGGMLVQTRDTHRLTPDDLKVVTRRAPTQDEIASLLFAWTVCKHTKSNAIVYAREGQTVGVGAGQMSRVDSVRLGAARAQLSVAGSVVASDAFFPFRDGIDEAARHGITAVIQPGGSVRDAEVITAADEHNLAMVFTGVRHFKH